MKTKAQRWCAAFDSHGDNLDPKAGAAFAEFVKWWKPSIRIAGGDHFDARPLRKKASKEERREKIKTDVAAGCDWLKQYAPTHFLRGNHDERFWDGLKSDDGRISESAETVVGEIMAAVGTACIVYPYDKRLGVCRLGHLKIIHGYSAGVYATRVAAQVYGSVLMGHIHAIDHYSIPGIERRIGRACGCLCKLDMDYNRAQIQTLRQAHGWAYGLLYPSGDYVAWQAEMVADRWHLPSEVRVIG